MSPEEEIKLLRTKLITETALHIKDMDDAYPDVGPGMSWNSCVQQALRQHGYTVDQIYIDKV